MKLGEDAGAGPGRGGVSQGHRVGLARRRTSRADARGKAGPGRVSENLSFARCLDSFLSPAWCLWEVKVYNTVVSEIGVYAPKKF